MSRQAFPIVEPLGVEIEGACDYVIGRPLREGNPYSRNSAREEWLAWRHGWLDARALFPRERLAREFVDTWGRWPAEERWAA